MQEQWNAQQGWIELTNGVVVEGEVYIIDDAIEESRRGAGGQSVDLPVVPKAKAPSLSPVCDGMGEKLGGGRDALWLSKHFYLP